MLQPWSIFLGSLLWAALADATGAVTQKWGWGGGAGWGGGGAGSDGRLQRDAVFSNGLLQSRQFTGSGEGARVGTSSTLEAVNMETSPADHLEWVSSATCLWNFMPAQMFPDTRPWLVLGKLFHGGWSEAKAFTTAMRRVNFVTGKPGAKKWGWNPLERVLHLRQP